VRVGVSFRISGAFHYGEAPLILFEYFGWRLSMLPGLISVLAAAALVAVDQFIKRWATAVLMPVGGITILPGIVELRYYLNDGMAFSMLAGQQKLLVIATTLMLIGVLAWLALRKMPMLERAAWTLVLGGGIGNLVDRIANGVVVDYINLLFMDFAVFNFADICICTGVGLLILAILLEPRKPEPQKGRDDGNG